MGGDGMDLDFDQASVAKSTQGVGTTIDRLGDLGGATGSVMGKGSSELATTGMDAGHHGPSAGFEDFCERWEQGVRALVSGTSAIANRLGPMAGTRWEHGHYVGGVLKVGVNTPAGGNPHAAEKEIARQDWGEAWKPDCPAPDRSADSWEQAGQEVGRTWKDTGRTVLTEGQGGGLTSRIEGAFGVPPELRGQALDDAFGPSPEKRAQQQRQSDDHGGD